MPRGHALAVVLSRLRQETGADARQDEETTLDRRFVLPDARTFAVSGTVRVDPNAPDPTVDLLLGTAAPGTRYEASSHLVGDLDARASRAFTGTPGDAWTSAIGPPNRQWVEVTRDEPITTDRITFNVRADADHAFPTAITVRADGHDVSAMPLSVPPRVARSRTPTAVPVTITFPTTTAHQFTLVVQNAARALGRPAPSGGIPTGVDLRHRDPRTRAGAGRSDARDGMCGDRSHRRPRGPVPTRGRRGGRPARSRDRAV